MARSTVDISNTALYRPTNWGESESAVISHYSKEFRDNAKGTFVQPLYNSVVEYEDSRTSSISDIQTSINLLNHTLKNYQTHTYYKYSPRSEPFKFVITAHCPSEKIITNFVVYSPNLREGILQCLYNYWLEDILITDIVARDPIIKTELFKLMQTYDIDNFPIQWKLKKTRDDDDDNDDSLYLFGYFTGNHCPIAVSIDTFIRCIQINTIDGVDCEIRWNISCIPLHRADNSILGFLRTNIPPAQPRTRIPSHTPIKATFGTLNNSYFKSE